MRVEVKVLSVCVNKKINENFSRFCLPPSNLLVPKNSKWAKSRRFPIKALNNTIRNTKSRGRKDLSVVCLRRRSTLPPTSLSKEIIKFKHNKHAQQQQPKIDRNGRKLLISANNNYKSQYLFSAFYLSHTRLFDLLWVGKSSRKMRFSSLLTLSAH